MLSPKNHLPLMVIGVLAAISIVLSSMIFKVEPMASENSLTMEERKLIDDSVFVGSASASTVREARAQVVEEPVMGTSAKAEGAAKASADVSDDIAETVPEDAVPEEPAETVTALEEGSGEKAKAAPAESKEQASQAEVVSKTPMAKRIFLQTQNIPEKIHFVIGLTPEDWTYSSTVPTAWPEEDMDTESEDREESADSEDAESEEESYEETWEDQDFVPTSDETEDEDSYRDSEPAYEEESEVDSYEEESSEESYIEEESTESSEESSESKPNYESDPGRSTRGTTDGSREVAGYTDLDYLAAICQVEAGSNYEGALAVANVVINRLNAGFASTIYDVIFAPYQFATTRIPGLLESGGVSSTCYQAAQDALDGINNVGSYLYFNGTYWLDPDTLDRPYVVIGGNCFY